MCFVIAFKLHQQLCVSCLCTSVGAGVLPQHIHRRVILAEA